MNRPASRAVFLDRDGTLIADPGYLNDPEQVTLLPGTGAALASLRQAGFKLVVVTNQSGMARGLITPSQFEGVMRRLVEVLRAEGTELDGWYHCPHLPNEGCDCRKPGVRLYRQAATELQLELAASWWVGDRMTDLEPAEEFGGGGRAVLVETGEGPRHRAQAIAAGYHVARDLTAASRLIRSAG